MFELIVVGGKFVEGVYFVCVVVKFGYKYEVELLICEMVV